MAIRQPIHTGKVPFMPGNTNHNTILSCELSCHHLIGLIAMLDTQTFKWTISFERLNCLCKLNIINIWLWTGTYFLISSPATKQIWHRAAIRVHNQCSLVLLIAAICFIPCCKHINQGGCKYIDRKFNVMCLGMVGMTSFEAEMIRQTTPLMEGNNAAW